LGFGGRDLEEVSTSSLLYLLNVLIIVLHHPS
jgi:hypothetical protein